MDIREAMVKLKKILLCNEMFGRCTDECDDCPFYVQPEPTRAVFRVILAYLENELGAVELEKEGGKA